VILPIGDSPNPPGIPVVTYLLLATNLAVYFFVTLPLSAAAPDFADPLLPDYVQAIASRFGEQVSFDQVLSQISAYDLVVFRYGYRPHDPSLTSLFTSLFLHASLMHLAGNMLFLWIYGDNVEHRLGRPRFLAAYLFTGVAATLFHAFFNSSSDLPLVGASGAISGVLGFYFVWFPRNRVHLMLLFPLFFRVAVSARTLLGLYVVVENLLPFLAARGVSGIAHGAHIGGFVAGAGIAWFLDRREIVGRPPDYRSRHGTAGADTIARAISTGDFPAAANAYFALPAESTRWVLRPDDSLSLADWLRSNGQLRAALVIYRRHLRDYPQGPNHAEAHLGAGLVQLETPGQETAAYQHFLEALDLDAAAETHARARAALSVIAARQQPSRPLYPR
jgi:membrane associated rhomboid family serine protease